MSATPRPWYWHKMTNEWPTICCDTGLNADRPVALVFGPNAEANNAEKTSKDNAELIVRAVNSFDAMREALEVMKDEKEILAEKLAKLEKELAFYKAKNGDASVCHACDGTGWVYG